MTENNDIIVIDNDDKPQAIAQIDPTSPAAIMMQLAQTGGEFDVDKMGKLLELQREHDKDQARKAYHVAMTAFHADAPKIIKTKQAHNCKHADLAVDLVAVVAPKLSEQGLSHAWTTKTDGDNITVSCRITHVLGHSEETVLTAGPDTSGKKNAIQAIGSTITYLQRYSLKAALGLAERGQDDDGNGGPNTKAEELGPPSEQQLEIIDEIINLLPPASSGFFIDRVKVAMFFARTKGGYPMNLDMIHDASENVVNQNPQSIYTANETNAS